MFEIGKAGYQVSTRWIIPVKWKKPWHSHYEVIVYVQIKLNDLEKVEGVAFWSCCQPRSRKRSVV